MNEQNNVEEVEQTTKQNKTTTYRGLTDLPQKNKLSNGLKQNARSGVEWSNPKFIRNSSENHLKFIWNSSEMHPKFIWNPSKFIWNSSEIRRNSSEIHPIPRNMIGICATDEYRMNFEWISDEFWRISDEFRMNFGWISRNSSEIHLFFIFFHLFH